MDAFLAALQSVFGIGNLAILFAATIAGITIGAIPGLTVTMAIALAVPLTLWMDTTSAMMLLLGLYGSGIYGGSISACLINAPGTPAAAATGLDGYALSKAGQPLKALRIALWSSLFGGLVSIVLLILIAPQLAEIALKFGPAEIAALLIFALTLIAVLSGGSMLKGLFAAALGMLLATVGADPMLSIPRFTIGFNELFDGFAYIPMLIGLFAIAELIEQAENRFRIGAQLIDLGHADDEANRVTREELRRCVAPTVRSSLIGSFIGMLPGLGSSVAAFLAYAETKRTSKEPERFGKGAVEGVASAESANNAVTGSAMIPMLALAIPGDPPTAILLGALMIQGVTTGPMIFATNPEVIYSIYIVLLVALGFMAIIATIAIKPISQVLRIPKVIMFPVILVMCVAGSFAIRGNVFDVFVMFGAGLLGYILRIFSVPVAPLLISFILTGPFEESMRQALIGSEGSLAVFIEKPIALFFILLAVAMIGSAIWRGRRGSTNALPQSD